MLDAGPACGMGDPTTRAHIYSNFQFWKMAPTLAYKLTGDLRRLEPAP